MLRSGVPSMARLRFSAFASPDKVGNEQHIDDAEHADEGEEPDGQHLQVHLASPPAGDGDRRARVMQPSATSDASSAAASRLSSP